MNSKKAITLLLIATMALALIPVMPVSAAVGITSITPAFDDEGSTIVVIGDGVVAGKTVRLYWDLVQDWDNEAGLLNSSKAESDGTWEIWFDVPEAVNGTHYIWVEDSQTLDTANDEFEVISKVDPSSDAGLDDDDVEIEGFGFSGDTEIAIVFNDTAPQPLTNASIIDGDDATTEWDGTLDVVPIQPGTVELTNGTSVWDNGDGTFGGNAGDRVNGTINYVTGEWEVTFLSAYKIAYADYDINYNAFYDEDDNMKVFTTSVETNDVGSFTKDITIPDYAEGNYGITVIDGKGVNATAAFALGAVITLDVEEGPVGTVVEVSGRGFTNDDYVYRIVLNERWICYNTSEEQVGTRGTFDVDFIIPSVPDEDDYEITVVVDDDGAFADATNATADFEVTGLPEIEVSPEYGGVNDLITIYGYNFSQYSGADIDVKLQDPNGVKADVECDTFETTNSGEWEATFNVPAAANQLWEVNATVPDHQINATTNFRVGIVVALLSPTEGAVGTDITVSGVGFTDNGDWNASIEGDLLAEGQADADGVFTDNFFIPNLDPGTYTIEVLDIDSEIVVETTIEVTGVTYLEIDPVQAANDYNLTIYGYNFAEDEDMTDFEIILWNETDEWDISDDVFNYSSGLDVQTDDDLEMDEGGITFVGWWTVSDDDTLDVGTYWLNVTDEEGIFAQIQVDVVTEVVDVAPKKSAYAIGDTVAFNIKSTFKQVNSYFKLYDSSGNLYWQSDALDDDSWLKVGYEQVVPFYAQTSGGNPMILVSDAPLGTWTWELYDADDDVIEEGTFVVESAAADVIGEQVADLNNQITDLADQLTDVTSEFDDVKSDIADVAAIAEQAVTAAQQAAEAVETVAQTANTASQAAADAATAAEAARDAANGLTTLVYGAIGAALVAALAAIVSLMQISRRIAG
jgi:hypothetical protein